MYNIISQVFICMLGGGTVCQIMKENGAKKISSYFENCMVCRKTTSKALQKINVPSISFSNI